MTSGVTDIVVGDGGHLTYAHAQLCGPDTVTFSYQHARLARDAKLITLNFGMGGRLSKTDVEVELRGPGAESDMLGLVFADGDQQFDYHTLQGHRSPDTRSDLLYKNALDGNSHSIYTGVIVIERGAQRSNAYQANRNLLLSNGARAATEPKLEIEADDVRCTHGATVGPIDEEQLFYLSSRGLDPEVGSRLIVEGFFQEVFEKVGEPSLTTPLHELIAPHIERLGAQ
jgi:Fe-S cluster assembly protein SufD